MPLRPSRSRHRVNGTKRRNKERAAGREPQAGAQAPRGLEMDETAVSSNLDLDNNFGVRVGPNSGAQVGKEE